MTGGPVSDPLSLATALAHESVSAQALISGRPFDPSLFDALTAFARERTSIPVFLLGLPSLQAKGFPGCPPLHWVRLARAILRSRGADAGIRELGCWWHSRWDALESFEDPSACGACGWRAVP